MMMLKAVVVEVELVVVVLMVVVVIMVLVAVVVRVVVMAVVVRQCQTFPLTAHCITPSSFSSYSSWSSS